MYPNSIDSTIYTYIITDNNNDEYPEMTNSAYYYHTSEQARDAAHDEVTQMIINNLIDNGDIDGDDEYPTIDIEWLRTWDMQWVASLGEYNYHVLTRGLRSFFS